MKKSNVRAPSLAVFAGLGAVWLIAMSSAWLLEAGTPNLPKPPHPLCTDWIPPC